MDAKPSRRLKLWPLVLTVILLAHIEPAVWVPAVWAAESTTSKTTAAQNKSLAEQQRFFEMSVRPLLAKRCWKCHGADRQEGKLRLDSQAGVLKGGESGAAIVPGDAAKSRAFEAVNYRGLEMPPDRKLPRREVEILQRWIESGANWPNPLNAPQAGAAPSASSDEPRLQTRLHQARSHWSFQRLVRPSLPPAVPGADENAAGSKPPAVNTIDCFIREKLAQRKLRAAPPASRRQLIRRATIDLLGVPPEPDELRRFVADDSADAFARLVDRLLADPRYGERWGRHWLDLVRFAQTNGYERDDEKPQAWRYRDYAIDAFNQDLPYDRFIQEQLAGDELADINNDSIVATGFYRLGVWDDEPDDKIAARLEGLDDVLRTIGETFLGLTIGCARCHDHKFDPVAQVEYYQLLAYIDGIAPYGRDKSLTHWELDPNNIFTPLITAEVAAEWRNRQSQLRTQQTMLEAELKSSVSDAAKKTLQQKLAVVRKQLSEPGFPQALSVRSLAGVIPKTQVLIRGNHLTPGPVVEPQFPNVFKDISTTPANFSRGSSSYRKRLQEYGWRGGRGRRLQLAQWIANRENPLTARVLVNRLWQHHFGHGLVATPSDFGMNGSPPSHPELLDWLAAELIEGGWHIKRIHRLIMLSHTYRQSSRIVDTAETDPANRLFARQSLRRMDAETLRDTILAVSGQLNLERGGRGFFPALGAEVLSSQSRPGSGWGKSPVAQQKRRSVYIYVKRTLGVPLLEGFDAPVPDKPEPRRPTTTVAPQALTLLNSSFVQQQAGFLAERVLKQSQRESQSETHGTSLDGLTKAISCAYRYALSRQPTHTELAALVALAERKNGQSKASPSSSNPLTAAPSPGLVAVCHLILNLNEFIYVD